MRTIHGFTFLNRSQRRQAPSLSLSASLPPRELFADYPEVLDLYDRFTRLQAGIREHSAAEAKHQAAAKEAEQQYARDLREAVATGSDPDKIKSKQPAELEQAAKAQELYLQARRGLQETSVPLAAALANVAEKLAADAEARLLIAAEKVNDARDALAQAQAEAGEAWGVRRAFGALAIFGGQFTGVTHSRPSADPLGDLATLKGEEEWMRDWFERDDAAAAANARMFGTR